jgi:Polysaccharide lyase
MFPDGRISLETTGVAATSANGRAIHFSLLQSDFPGCYSSRTEIAQGNPIKSGDPANRTLHPGDDEWFAWEAYFPASYPLTPAWDRVHGSPWGGGMVQWHQAGGCNAPPFNLGVRGGNAAGELFVFYESSPTDCPVGGTQREWYGGTSAPIYHNQWYKFMVHANFETNTTGFFNYYVDLNDGQGMKLRFASPPTYTLYSNALPSQARAGLLNNSGWQTANNQDLYISGYTAATSQAAAAANAFGSP